MCSEIVGIFSENFGFTRKLHKFSEQHRFLILYIISSLIQKLAEHLFLVCYFPFFSLGLLVCYVMPLPIPTLMK